mmetsp:Transcript_119562/g.283950  ORF Transcript_119562/g.283950 Transcript_119562/m.283950 type:complete len:108 (+) Transcript_119562:57-380(+)
MDVTTLLGVATLVALLAFCCLFFLQVLRTRHGGWQLDLVETELEGEVCAICLEPMRSGAPLCCGHAFHLACIRECWAKRLECTCPLCRQKHVVPRGKHGAQAIGVLR